MRASGHATGRIGRSATLPPSSASCSGRTSWSLCPTAIRRAAGSRAASVYPITRPCRSARRAKLLRTVLHFHLPDDTVRLHYFGPAHCDGDIVVHLEKRRVAFLGDLLFHGRFPWLGDCDLDGLISALGRVLALDIAVVVPGHGPPATLADVARFRDMLAELRAAVDRAVKTGASEEAAVAEVALPQYAHIQRYAEWMA